ncbi:unnamed protein product [Rotaria socialis]|uniref:NAD(P)(+)--arginine ADP-ribosyltransferase n=1 Tax=Rotaria socialis TaxID=392032 RepID=A0A818GT25_9BILA|nr:unnamed protein product [Rotaria socialis]CAF4655001.1 unnamed protein product [Rotaria socialis]
MVSKGKEVYGQPKDDLTADESISLMLYPRQWEPREKLLYIILNNTLRAEDEEKLKLWQLYLKLFISSLEKLPTVSKTIYRGVKRNLSTEYPIGKKLSWWSFSSCASSIKVVQSEQFLGKTGARTLFNITFDSGKDIKQHSFFSTEDEVLLIAAQKCQLVSGLDSGNDLFIIQMKEVDSDQSLLEFSSSQPESSRLDRKLSFSPREDSTTTTTGSSEPSKTTSSREPMLLRLSRGFLPPKPHDKRA